MAAFTPYLIEKEAWTPQLSEARDRILRALGGLGPGLPIVLLKELAGVLEVVNSYYSNRMEGNPTRIGDIFAAQEGHLARTETERNYQLEHLAHIYTARKMRTLLLSDASLSPAGIEFLKMLHREFYSQLPVSMCVATTLSGSTVPIIPGELRRTGSTVGQHHAVPADQVNDCLQEFEKAYGSMGFDSFVPLAAAHHRFLWIHPFADGNGRVARLMSEAMALRANADGHGLYSIARGLARRRKEYDAALAGADASRWNDLDGRGNLSMKGLLQFCEFFLDVMADQVEFMGTIMDRAQIQTRFTRFMNVLRAEKLLSGTETVVLTHLLRIGEMRRGEIQAIAGIKSRQANIIAGRLLRKGFVQSDSPKGRLRLKANREMVRALFPEFYD